MILRKQKSIEYLITLLVVFLALTDVFVFKISGLPISIYIFFGPIFIAIVSLLKFQIPSLNNSIPFLILLYILFSSFLNFKNVRITSVIYSLLFIVYYIYLNFSAKNNLSKEKFTWVLKVIIVSFFIVLLLSQFIVFFNLEELKGPKGYFQNSAQFGILFNNRTNVFRYHSLSSEPSYAAIIIILCFTVLIELIKTRKVLYLYGALVLYMLIAFKSSIGFLILGTWFISQVSLSKKQFLILGTIVFVGISLFFFTSIGGKSIDRLRDVVFLLLSFNGDFVNNLNLIDSSAYARIGPLAAYIQGIDVFSYQTYFGFGASTSEAIFSNLIYPETWNKHLVFKPPFLPGFLYDYGVFGVLLVLYLIWKTIKAQNFFFKITFIIILLNSNFNTQLFWFAFTLVSLKTLYNTQPNRINLK
jgi:hypothetical protein